MKDPKKISVVMDIDVDNLKDHLLELSIDDIFEFIVDLELSVAEYELSEKLYEHFSKAHEEYLADIKEETDE